VLRALGKLKEARAAHEAARQALQGLGAETPNEADDAKDLARCYYNLGIVYRETKEFDKAVAAFTTAIELLEPLVKRHPDRDRYKQELARSWLNLGPVAKIQQGAPAAHKAYDQAILLLIQLREKSPEQPDYRHELGVTFNSLGILLRQTKDYAGSEQYQLQARQLFQALVEDFPSVPTYRKELALTCASLGLLQALRKDIPQSFSCPQRLDRQAKNWAEAEAYCQQARSLLAKLVEQFPHLAEYHGRLGMTLGYLGWMRWRQQKDLPQARELLEQGISQLQLALELNRDDPDYQRSLAEQKDWLARVNKLLEN
jgi:tetratricopeptide (TPR) repeat protein